MMVSAELDTHINYHHHAHSPSQFEAETRAMEGMDDAAYWRSLLPEAARAMDEEKIMVRSYG